MTDTKRSPGRPRKDQDEPTFTHEEKLQKEHDNHVMRQQGEEKDEYPEGIHATEPGGEPTPETTVEHPLAPTDEDVAREQQNMSASVVTNGDDPNDVKRNELAEDVEIEGTGDHPHGVHVGDGRVLMKGQRMKVGKETAKALVDGGNAKKVRGK